MFELALALQLAAQCAPNVAPETMTALVRVESSNNPYAIGVVGGQLARQPTTKTEALTAVQELERQGRNFSMGLAQVNRHNLGRYSVTYEQVFDPCINLRVGGQILEDCYRRATPKHADQQAALRAALSCYYSGNFVRGFKPDKPGDPSYVDKVVAAAAKGDRALQVPAIASMRTKAVSGGPVEGSVLEPNDSIGARGPQALLPSELETDPVRLRAVTAVDPPPPALPAIPTEPSAVVF